MRYGAAGTLTLIFNSVVKKFELTTVSAAITSVTF
jgi:hypothetical protein